MPGLVYEKELCRTMDKPLSAGNLRFWGQNRVEHVMTAPYHPATNGAAQTFKGGVEKLKKGDIQTRLAILLFSYKITPQSTTGVSLAELLMGRRLRSALNFVKPDLHKRVERGTGKTKTCM